MTSHSLATKNWCSMLGCQVAEAINAYVLASLFPILASLSTSSTASTFVVSLSSMAAFFDGDAKLMASAVRMPMIRIVSPTLFEKEPGHVSAMVHASMRDKTYPV